MRSSSIAEPYLHRGRDLVALRVDDVAPNGYAFDRANVRQRKTGRPIRFELTETPRQALDDDLRGSDRRPGAYLFPGRRDQDRPLTTRQYARLVSRWVVGIGLDPPHVRHAFHAPNQSDAHLALASLPFDDGRRVGESCTGAGKRPNGVVGPAVPRLMGWAQHRIQPA